MRVSGRFRRGFAVLLAVCTATAVTSVGAANAESFYEPPSPLPSGAPGDIIKHEPTDFFIDPVKGVRAPAAAQRVMYRSTDTHGQPAAVTGTVLTPDIPWNGKGERPLVAYAPGTQGVGDDCAPSKAMASGQEYEGVFVAGLLARGYAVVVTDYEGLGTPGTHTYVNRAAEAHAVLDALKAAQRLPEAGLPTDGPVATSGYSQGGGASAAAAELQSSYAPELTFKGSYAGGTPADLGKVAKNLDGNYGAGLLGYSLLSMDAAYPELHIKDVLNDKGKQMLDDVSHQCIAEAVAGHTFAHSPDLTKDGKSLASYLDEEPFASRVAEQKIGERAPAAPVLVTHSTHDELLPYPQARQMARSWCAKGTQVQFSSLTSPSHVAGALEAYPEAFGWLEQRFAGAKAPDNCGSF